MKKDLIELVFILDRSGSMAGLESDTIGGYNNFISQQDKTKELMVTTVLFDHQYEVLYDGVKPEMAMIDASQYFVRGSTALLDAVGNTITQIDRRHLLSKTEFVPEKTIFIITTDGMENASHEYRYDQIKTMITNKREQSHWEFVFLGANIDVDRESDKLGINRQFSHKHTNSKQGIKEMYSACNVMCDEIINSKKQ